MKNNGSMSLETIVVPKVAPQIENHRLRFIPMSRKAQRPMSKIWAVAFQPLNFSEHVRLSPQAAPHVVCPVDFPIESKNTKTLLLCLQAKHWLQISLVCVRARELEHTKTLKILTASVEA